MTHNSLEDSALQLTFGFSDDQITKMHLALEEGQKSLNIIQAMLKMAKDELPRIERTVATLTDLLATFNANQRRYRNG